MKKAKKGTQYFHCTLQTSPTKTLRVVGFDQATHNQCQHFETTGNPVKLVNVREDNGQILVNQQSTLLQMSNSDVTLQYTPSSLSADCTAQNGPAVTSTDISLNHLQNLTRNQKVNVKGVITLGHKPPKQVKKRNGENGTVKEDCAIEDATGHTVLNIWDEMINKLQTSKSYSIKNLSVKNYSRNTMLGTTVTTFKEVSSLLQQVQGSNLLRNTDKKVTAKLNIYLQCQLKSCNKKIPYTINDKIVTCPSCSATQKTKSSKKAMSARLCADVDGTETWFAAFTDVLQCLLNKNKEDTPLTSNQISEALLSVENITVLVDTTSNYIKEIMNFE